MDSVGSTQCSTLVTELDSAHAAMTARQRRLLEVIAKCDRAEVWRADGCRDLAQWLSGRLGISNWAARRWIGAAHALPRLPLIRAAFVSGTLGFDKVLELCRFARPETEKRLVRWARRVGVAAVRRRADLANRPPLDEVVDADRERFVRYWWYDDGKRLGLEGSLGADQGAVVASALDRLAERVPEVAEDAIVDEHGGCERRAVCSGQRRDARRADALVAMASREIANDQEPDRATVVVHADLDALRGDRRGAEVERGPVVHPETARRLACDARLQVVLHEPAGRAVGIGRADRTVPAWVMRELRHRDRTCTFPGCECSRFVQAHHILHWIYGGETELDNLVLVCSFHHKLVHEYRWRVELDPTGCALWFRPTGNPSIPVLFQSRSCYSVRRRAPEPSVTRVSGVE